MGYLLTEIVVYLVIAGLIGFTFGWLVRDGVLDKYFDKVVGLLTKAKEEVKEEVTDVKEEVAPAKVAEVIKEEVKETVETKEPVKEVAVEKVPEVIKEEVAEIVKEVEVVKPKLFTEAPIDGQDKLSSIKGIGPVLEKKLNELGIYSFEQIASWDAEQEVWIGTQMAFPKRVTKEEWVKQAKELVKNK